MSPESRLDQRTREVDRIVQANWPRIPELALTAVGGYGRGELFPYSDVDLLLVVTSERNREGLKDRISPMLRTLWDSGLRVSQSVHTLEECRQVADDNVELSVSLLDRRFLAGSLGVFEDLRDPHRDRLAPALARLTRERHHEYQDTIYHLEPNIKDAPGGLRDLQVLRWMAKLDSSTPEPIPHDLLFNIRFVLHEAARRDQNVLTHAMQDECADKLGFKSTAELMRAYFRQARYIFSRCNRRREAEETRRSPLFAQFRDRGARLSNSDFSVLRGRVYLRTPLSGAGHVARLFEFIARHDIPLSPDAEDRVGAYLTSFDACGFTWANLLSILSQEHGNVGLRAMHDTGLLYAVFPALREIDSFVIRDFYHRYTVDEHTLVTIDHAYGLRSAKDRFGDLARETAGHELLVSALIFHDVGKSIGDEGHALSSARTAEVELRRLNTPEAELATILFLIEAHLEMSRLMTTRDVSDVATARELAARVLTVERLKLLTILTWCDISSVHPGAMTPWRETLLWKLFAQTERFLTQSLESERVERGDAEGLPWRYVITHSPDEIIEHRNMELHSAAHGVAIKLWHTGPVYRITVVTHDRTGLFASIVGALASFGMSVVRAEAFANVRGTAIDSFTFADPMRTLELNPPELHRLEQVVADTVLGKRKAEDLLKGRAPYKRPGKSSFKAHVTVDSTASDRATLFHVVAEDRPRLLYELAEKIASFDCDIDVVLIDTEGRKALDVFYVMYMGLPLSDAVAQHLRQELERVSGG